jgi:RHS repeat-associated protein
VTTVAYGNGRSTQYEYYDHTRRLKRMTTGGASTIQDIRYTYDMASNILSVTDAAHTGTQSCALSNIVYDDLYRLTSVFSTADNRTITYAYNALGNVVTNGEMGTGTYTYHATKVHAVTAANGSTYAYDACGNMTNRNRSGQANQTLTYDEQNRLKQVAITGGSTVQFGYSAGGSRLWKKVGSQVTNLWIGSLYEEKDGNILCHVYAGGRLVATFEPESSFACFIQHHPYLAAIWNFGSGVATALFGGGRAPMSVMGLAILAGLFAGRPGAKRRAASSWRGRPALVFVAWASRPWIPNHGQDARATQGQDALATTVPLWRRVILTSLAASVFLSSSPQAAYAGTPVYDPVFYYYHPDHLGSSQLMTDRDGDVVQQYGYSPFGRENYKNNIYAFPVSSRYTGQTLDEDTGLYYYGARYYDPELARFIQADSTIPDPEFSQAYNRYAYVYNNPLKFTDPTGQNPFAIALFVIGTTKVTVGTIVVSACISAGITALAGGDPMKGFALGLMGGFLGGCFGAIANSAFIGAVAAGALTGVMSGGDPLMGALTAGVSAGIASAFAEMPVPSFVNTPTEAYLWQLTMSTCIGALAGGVNAEMSGGNFGTGAAYGAAGAAAGFAVSMALRDYLGTENPRASLACSSQELAVIYCVDLANTWADLEQWMAMVDIQRQAELQAELEWQKAVWAGFWDGYSKASYGIANTILGGLFNSKNGILYKFSPTIRNWSQDSAFKTGANGWRVAEVPLIGGLIAKAFGYNPWLGKIAYHYPHGGGPHQYPHIQIMIRAGAHTTKHIRIPWPW